MATHEGISQDKTNTPKSVPKLIIPGIVSKNLYNLLSFGFFISKAFEISKYSPFSMWPQWDLNPCSWLEKPVY